MRATIFPKQRRVSRECSDFPKSKSTSQELDIVRFFGHVFIFLPCSSDTLLLTGRHRGLGRGVAHRRRRVPCASMGMTFEILISRTVGRDTRLATRWHRPSRVAVGSTVWSTDSVGVRNVCAKAQGMRAYGQTVRHCTHLRTLQMTKPFPISRND